MDSRRAPAQDPPDLLYRGARPEDADIVLSLLLHCDVLESGEPGTSMDDLLQAWRLLQPEQDVRLAFHSQTTLVGYAAVFPWADRLRYDLHVDPAWRETGLPARLLAWCEEHARSMPALGIRVGNGVTVAFVSHVDWQGALLVEEAGFRAERTHLNLQATLDDQTAPAMWPEGVSVRDFRPGSDDHNVYEVIQASFDRPDRRRPSFESWRDFMMRSDTLDPCLWFLAEASADLVGACLCFQYPEEGWVRQLGVLPAWQKRGIGEALLRHAFMAFRRRGFTKVGLSVASDNPLARGFYDRLGMRSLRQYVEYVRPEGEPFDPEKPGGLAFGRMPPAGEAGERSEHG